MGCGAKLRHIDTTKDTTVNCVNGCALTLSKIGLPLLLSLFILNNQASRFELINHLWDISLVFLLLLEVFLNNKTITPLLGFCGGLTLLSLGHFFGVDREGVFILAAYFGYLVASNSKLRLLDITFFFLVVNAIAMLMQISGKFPLLNSLGDYGNAHESISRLRPSGIFVGPVYVTFFVYTFLLILANSPIVKVSHVLVLAASMALSGSSSSYITCLALLAVGGRPYKFGIVCSFGLFLLIYSICLPDFFFTYNYSIENLILSLEARLSLNYLSSYSNLALAVPFILLVFALVVRKMIGIFHRLGWFFFWIYMGISPVLIHDFTRSVFFWLYVGILSAMMLNEDYDSKRGT